MQFSPLSGKVSYSAGEPTILNPSGNRSVHNISQSKHFLNKSINYVLKKIIFCLWRIVTGLFLVPASFLFPSSL